MALAVGYSDAEGAELLLLLGFHLAHPKTKGFFNWSTKTLTLRGGSWKSQIYLAFTVVNCCHGAANEHVPGSNILYLLVHFVTRENGPMIINYPMLISLPVLVNGSLLCHWTNTYQLTMLANESIYLQRANTLSRNTYLSRINNYKWTRSLSRIQSFDRWTNTYYEPVLIKESVSNQGIGFLPRNHSLMK